MTQRFFDILFSSVAIIILFPFGCLISIVLMFSGEGEIFYIQKRIGLNGQEFGLIKFATMLKNSPSIGTKTITLKKDPRILPFGRLLRLTKINELPQLINVILGDMSVVGPRPMVPETYCKYPKDAQFIINKVRPGLSGLGSIVFRDEERFLSSNENSVTFYRKNIIPYKAELEVWFVEQRSIVLYFQIIFLTIWVILFPKSDLINKIIKNYPREPSWMQ